MLNRGSRGRVEWVQFAKCCFFCSPLFAIWTEKTGGQAHRATRARKRREGGEGMLLPGQPEPRQLSSWGFFCIVCMHVWGHSACVCEFTLLSPDRRRGHPPLTLCQRREEEREREAERERERERLKPHNALHAAGLKSCRFISSCSEGLCVSAHTHTHTHLVHPDRVRERQTQTTRQVRRLFFWPCGQILGLQHDVLLPLERRSGESCSTETTGCH